MCALPLLLAHSIPGHDRAGIEQVVEPQPDILGAQVVGADRERRPVQRAGGSGGNAEIERAVVGVAIFQSDGPKVGQRVFDAGADIPAGARPAAVEHERAVAVADEAVGGPNPGPAHAAGDVEHHAVEGDAARSRKLACDRNRPVVLKWSVATGAPKRKISTLASSLRLMPAASPSKPSTKPPPLSPQLHPTWPP